MWFVVPLQPHCDGAFRFWIPCIRVQFQAIVCRGPSFIVSHDLFVSTSIPIFFFVFIGPAPITHSHCCSFAAALWWSVPIWIPYTRVSWIARFWKVCRAPSTCLQWLRTQLCFILVDWDTFLPAHITKIRISEFQDEHFFCLLFFKSLSITHHTFTLLSLYSHIVTKCSLVWIL